MRPQSPQHIEHLHRSQTSLNVSVTSHLFGCKLYYIRFFLSPSSLSLCAPRPCRPASTFLLRFRHHTAPFFFLPFCCWLGPCLEKKVFMLSCFLFPPIRLGRHRGDRAVNYWFDGSETPLLSVQLGNRDLGFKNLLALDLYIHSS